MKKYFSLAFISLLFLSTTALADPLGPDAAATDPYHDEQMQRQIAILDDLDARIDEEERKGYLQAWQANQLRNEVQTMRIQERNYIQQDAFDAKAAAIARQLDPPMN